MALDPSNTGPPTPAGQQEEEQVALLTKIWDLTVSVTFCLMLAKWDFLCYRDEYSIGPNVWKCSIFLSKLKKRNNRKIKKGGFKNESCFRCWPSVSPV